MDTRKFLERVLPSSGGDYFSSYKSPDGKLKQSPPLKTLEALVADIERRRAERVDVFYGTGVYDGSRKANKTVLKKALYVDVDTAGSHAGYATKRKAAEALAAFHRSTNFPLPNIVVDSGRGLHFYWTLDQPVEASRWALLATSLKSLCASAGFRVDESITADAARILRVPGTLNFKDPSAPIRCVLLKADPTDFSCGDLEVALGVQQVGDRARTGAVDNDDLGANLYSDREYYAADIFEKCEVMKHTRETGGKDQVGMLWFRILHLLAYTVDGGKYIHDVSSKHDSYSSEAVDRRYRYAIEQKDKGTGPTLCSTLEGFLPSKCAACPHRGKIKTPLVLGRKEDALYPASYRITDEGVFRKVQVPGSTDVELNLVIPYKIHNVELLFNASGKSLKFDATYKGKSHTLVVPTVSLVGDSKELAQAMMSEDIMLSEAGLKEFKQLMIPWMRQLNAVKETTKTAITGMGWLDNPSRVGFAAGVRIYLEDGTTEMVSGLDRQLCREFDPSGSPEPWQKIRDAILGDQNPAITTAVLTAFAAPLLKFTGVNGVLFSLVSRESGTGKSTALRVAQSVWGDPKRGINALNDTVLSVSKRMGFLNNLPAYWDEVRMRDEVQNFVKMIFRLGQGKERSRLQSSTKFQEMGTWATITTVATNEPIADHMDRASGNTNAGRLRMFEVNVPSRAFSAANVSALSEELDRNYGHVGSQYAKYLARNGRNLQGVVNATFERLESSLNATKDERFWIAFMTTILVSAAICNKEGYLAVDVVRLKDWLVSQLQVQRAGVAGKFKAIDSAAVSVLVGYLELFRDQLLVVDRVPASASVLPVVEVQPVVREILGMIGSKDRRLRIKRQNFEKFVYEQGESPTQIIEQLVASGAKLDRASVTAGLANTTNVKVPVIEVDLNDQMFDKVGVTGR